MAGGENTGWVAQASTLWAPVPSNNWPPWAIVPPVSIMSSIKNCGFASHHHRSRSGLLRPRVTGASFVEIDKCARHALGERPGLWHRQPDIRGPRTTSPRSTGGEDNPPAP